MKNISKNEALKVVRKELGLTQEQFAREIKVTPPYISSIESGARVPSDTILELLIYKFSVNREWLQTGEGAVFTKAAIEPKMGTLTKKEKLQRDAVVTAAVLGAVAPIVSAGIVIGVGASVIIDNMCKVYKVKNANVLAKKHFNIERSTITNWIKKNKIPKKYIDKAAKEANLQQSTLVFDETPLYITRNLLVDISSHVLEKHGVFNISRQKIDQCISESLGVVGYTEIITSHNTAP